jgi:hypothetical protein
MDNLEHRFSIERGALYLDSRINRAAEEGDTLLASAGGNGRRIRAVEIADILSHDFPPMEPLLDPWLCKQHLTMVYAYRGLGKTHFALSAAYAVAGGGSFLNWNAPKPRKVLYIDGEMPGALMKSRLAGLVASYDEAVEPQEGYFRMITPDLQELPLPDLATPQGQAALDPVIEDAELIVLDNLSTLTRNGPENEGESWLPVAEWALKRRREGRAVMFIHHEGKNGKQRGSSRKEDILDVVIRLKRPADYIPDHGAQFLIEFEKSRGLYGEAVKEIEAMLTDIDGRQVWTWRAADDSTFNRVIELTRLGMKQAEIAHELGVNRSTVCRHLQRARDEGMLAPERT